jgi:hypothetical protein
LAASAAGAQASVIASATSASAAAPLRIAYSIGAIAAI